MASREYPRRTTAAALALRALCNTGGRSTADGWAMLLDWKGNAGHFKLNIIDRLRVCGLIIAAGDLVEVTSDGYKYMGFIVPAAVEIKTIGGQVAGPRTVSSKATLNLARHFPPRPQRPEGNEYRAIPSLMAGRRVEFGSGVAAADA